MRNNTSIDQETFDYNSGDESFCSDDYQRERIEAISPITLCRDDRSHMEYSSQLCDLIPSSIIQMTSLESLDTERLPLLFLKEDSKPSYKIKTVCESHSNEEGQNQQIREIIMQVNQVKHQLLLAHIELKQYNMHNHKLRDGIESLQNIVLKAQQRLEDGSIVEENNSFLSTKEERIDTNTSDDEDDYISEIPVQEDSSKIHRMNKSMRDLKNKDMLWRNFSCNIKQLMDEIDGSHTNFSMLPRVKSMLDLLEVKPSHRENTGDSFINHILERPALVQYHFDKLLEEIQEKEEEIKKIKEDLASIQSEKESLLNSNKLLKAKINEQGQKKPPMILRRRTTTRDEDTSSLHHQEQIESPEDFIHQTETKILNLCRNLFKTWKTSRNKLDLNLGFLKNIQITKKIVQDLDKDEAMKEIYNIMEIHKQNEDNYCIDQEKELENANQIMSSLKRCDRISYFSNIDSSTLYTCTSSEIAIPSVKEEENKCDLLDRIDSLDLRLSRICDKVRQNHIWKKRNVL